MISKSEGSKLKNEFVRKLEAMLLQLHKQLDAEGIEVNAHPIMSKYSNDQEKFERYDIDVQVTMF